MRKYQQAFTIVELIVVISVIGILAVIGVASYGAWRDKVARDEIVSGLNQLNGAMQNELNFNNLYPAPSTFPTSFATGSGSVTIKTVQFNLVTATDQLSYCARGRSTVKTSINYWVNPPNVITPTTTKPLAAECSTL